MTNQHTHFRLRLGSKRLSFPLRLAATGAVLSATMLGASGTAVAAQPGNVVSANGKVAGHGYRYWLMRSWQATFNASPPAHPCQSVLVDGRRVAYLTLKTIAPGARHYTCNEPAGRPLYLVGLSSECSTFKGDHANYRTSDHQLMRCAHALFAGAKDTTTLDGRSVNVDELIAATGAYNVDSPRNNPFGLPSGKGRSAAYGFGLLLTGFPRRTHSIHSLWSIGTSHWDVRFTVHVGQARN